MIHQFDVFGFMDAMQDEIVILDCNGVIGECHELCVSGLAHAGFR